jgi:hypothetical protein
MYTGWYISTIFFGSGENPVSNRKTPRGCSNHECGDHDALARKALAVGGHRVVPGVDRLDAGVSHRLTLAA